MKNKVLRIFWAATLVVFFIYLFPPNRLETSVCSPKVEDKSGKKKISESWMGVYMKGIKVGYSHSQELIIDKKGKKYKKSLSESWLRVSRLIEDFDKDKNGRE